jgi:hypothetical protein
MQSFPQTGDHGDRSNQSGYQHPILNVDAQDAEFFNKRMQGSQTGLPSLTPKKGPSGRKGTRHGSIWVRKRPIPIKFCFREPASARPAPACIISLF